MVPQQNKVWKIELHTKAKHEILRRYLGAWFGILGSKIPRVVYIDGFCGPGGHSERHAPLLSAPMRLMFVCWLTYGSHPSKIQLGLEGTQLLGHCPDC
ncbi:MAG: hypothetical protein ACPLUL_11530 [Thermanaerothrix sp.]|uniref:hypothetical protein n=1 Tax=Thermanaerothrix sp. TaxID=2972675 RepID=UPI003C79AB1B